MDINKFTEALQEAGTSSYVSGISLRVKDCPECGKKKFNVIFRIHGTDNERYFLGKCLSGSCGKGFSSASYLRQMGMESSTVAEYHGFDHFKNLESALKEAPNPFFAEKEIEEPQIKVFDISGFSTIEDNLNHHISKYTISRKYNSKHREQVLIDKQSAAVVFVCRDNDGGVLGYQRRYVRPTPGGPKTKTSDGFSAHDNVLVFGSDNKFGIAICEGPFTALSAANYGFVGVCTFGSGISDKQLETIKHISSFYGIDKIYSATDQDEAGDKFFKKIYNYFYWDGIIVSHLIPEAGSDLNDSDMAGKGFIIKEGDIGNPAIQKFRF